MVEMKKMNRQRKEENRGIEREKKGNRERRKERNSEKQKQGFPHPVISDNRNIVLWVEMDNLSNSTINNSSLILSFFLSFFLEDFLFPYFCYA